MKAIFRNVFPGLVMAIFLLSSCVGSKHQNFDQQKYTDLKFKRHQHTNVNVLHAFLMNESLEQSFAANDQVTAATTQNNTPDDSVKVTNCDTLFLNSGKELLCTILSQSEKEIRFTNCPPDDKEYMMPVSGLRIVPGEVVADEVGSDIDIEFVTDTTTIQYEEEVPSPYVDSGTQRPNFENLSEHQKTQNLIAFNRLYNAALLLFIISLFIACMALLLISTNILTGLVIALGSVLLFTAWILSMVGKTKVKKINLDNYSAQLNRRVTLMRIGAGLGIAVCIVTILGGIVLLGLWLTKTI
jgi:hypothetical protein